MTEGRVPKEAVVRAEVTLGSALGGEPPVVAEAFDTVGAAREGATGVVARVAASATDQFASAVRLQAMAGQVRKGLPV